jgi:hypothetical protein
MSRPIITPVTRPVVTIEAAPEAVLPVIEDTTPAVLCDTCGVNHSNFLGMNVPQLEGLRDTMNNSVRVPLVAPVRPERTEFGFHFRVENMTPAQKYATGINLCRQRNVGPGVVCGVCGEDECQGSAGSNWYGIFGWIACHMHCWQDLVWRYHQHRDAEGEVASMHGFLRFIAD